MGKEDQVRVFDRHVADLESQFGVNKITGLTGFKNKIRNRLANPKHDASVGKQAAHIFNEEVLNTVLSRDAAGDDVAFKQLLNSEYQRRIEDGAPNVGIAGGLIGGLGKTVAGAAPFAAAGAGYGTLSAGPVGTAGGAVIGGTIGAIVGDSTAEYSRSSAFNYFANLDAGMDEDEAFKKAKGAALVSAGLVGLANAIPTGGLLTKVAAHIPVKGTVTRGLVRTLTAGNTKTGVTRLGIEAAKGGLDDVIIEAANVAQERFAFDIDNSEYKGNFGLRLGISGAAGAGLRGAILGGGKLAKGTANLRNGKKFGDNLFEEENLAGIIGDIDRQVDDASAGYHKQVGEGFEDAERGAKLADLKAAQKELHDMWNGLTNGTTPAKLKAQPKKLGPDGADASYKAGIINAFAGLFEWKGDAAKRHTLQHEAAHAHQETLPDQINGILVKLFDLEIPTAKQLKEGMKYSGPLANADGTLRKGLSTDLESKNRETVFKEWYAERTALKNDEWAKGKLADANERPTEGLFGQLAHDFRVKAKQIGRRLGMGDGLDRSFRDFLDAGDKYGFSRVPVKRAKIDPTNPTHQSAPAEPADTTVESPSETSSGTTTTTTKNADGTTTTTTTTEVPKTPVSKKKPRGKAAKIAKEAAKAKAFKDAINADAATVKAAKDALKGKKPKTGEVTGEVKPPVKTPKKPKAKTPKPPKDEEEAAVRQGKINKRAAELAAELDKRAADEAAKAAKKPKAKATKTDEAAKREAAAEEGRIAAMKPAVREAFLKKRAADAKKAKKGKTTKKPVQTDEPASKLKPTFKYGKAQQVEVTPGDSVRVKVKGTTATARVEKIDSDGVHVAIVKDSTGTYKRHQSVLIEDTKGMSLSKKKNLPKPSGKGRSKPQSETPRTKPESDATPAPATRKTIKGKAKPETAAGEAAKLQAILDKHGSKKKVESLDEIRSETEAKKTARKKLLDDLDDNDETLFSKRGEWRSEDVELVSDDVIVRERGAEIRSWLDEGYDSHYTGARSGRARAFEEQTGYVISVTRTDPLDGEFITDHVGAEGSTYRVHIMNPDNTRAPDKTLAAWIEDSAAGHQLPVTTFKRRHPEVYADAVERWHMDNRQGFIDATVYGAKGAKKAELYVNESGLRGTGLREESLLKRNWRKYPDDLERAADEMDMDVFEFQAAMHDANVGPTADGTKIGPGSAMYAEIATVAQSIKIGDLTGDVVGAGALGARRKLFRTVATEDVHFQGKNTRKVYRTQKDLDEANAKLAVDYDMLEAGEFSNTATMLSVTSKIPDATLFSKRRKGGATKVRKGEDDAAVLTRKFADRAADSDPRLAAIRDRRADIALREKDVQNLSDIKAEAKTLTRKEFDDNLAVLDTIRESGAKNQSVLRAMEDLEQSMARGDTKRTELVYEKLAKTGTTIGQLLRQFREFKGKMKGKNRLELIKLALLRGDGKRTKTGAYKNSRKLTPAQEAKLVKLIADDDAANVKVEASIAHALDNPTDVDAIKAAKKAEVEFDLAARKLANEARSVMPRYLRQAPADLLAMIQGNLLTLVSTMRNFWGNYVSVLPRTGARVPAAVMDATRVSVGNAFGDAATPKLTRKVALPTLRELAWAWEGTVKGAKKAKAALFHGSDTDVVLGETIRGFNPWKSWKRGWSGDLPVDVNTGKVRLSDRIGKLMEGALGAAPESMLRSLSAMDELAKEGFRGARASEEATLKGHAKGSKDLASARLQADAETKAAVDESALQFTYQDESRAAWLAGKIDDLSAVPVAGPMLRLAARVAISPYVRTPVNLFVEGTKFAVPIYGFLHSALKLKQGNQREAALSFGYAVTGLIIGKVAAELVAEDIISGGPDASTKKNLVRTTSGMGFFRFNYSAFGRWMANKIPGGGPQQDTTHRAGDVSIRLDSMGVAGYVFAVKAEAARLKEKAPSMLPDELFGGWDDLGSVIANGRFAVNQTMLQGVSGMIQALTRGNSAQAKWVGDKVNLVSSAVMPNTIMAARLMDEDALRPNLTVPGSPWGTAKNVIIYKFGNREDLNYKRDIFGNHIKATPPGQDPDWYHIINHFKHEEAADDALTDVYDLYRKTGDDRVIPTVVSNRVKHRGVPLTLSGQLYDSLFEQVQQAKGTAFVKVFDNARFRELVDSGDPEKAQLAVDFMAKMMTTHGNQAKLVWERDNREELSETAAALLEYLSVR
jgi:hypothetical protein